MRICLVSSARLPVQLYGGIERIVQWLAQEFVKLGHEVMLVARAGSALPGVRCIPADTREEALARIPRDVDIVHFHAWAPSSSDEFALPWLFTLHGNEPPPYPAHTIGISADHARRHGLPVFVHNGVDPAEFVHREQGKRDELLFFSKVRRRVKGAARAIRLARSHRQRLVVAGGWRFDLLKVGAFFPSLHPSISFRGEVGGAAKAELFAGAKAFLFPIAWDEPFGLVLVEAMLSGTPVVATPRGAVPELVPSAVGALFSKDEEFGAALECALQCRPADCREWAMEKFSSAVCARNHLALYERILDREAVFGALAPSPPRQAWGRGLG